MKKWIILVAATVVLGGLDLWTKHWAQTELQYKPSGQVTVVDGYFSLSYVRNPGAAWGFLARASESFRKPFFFAVSVAAVIFILFIFRRLESTQMLMMLGLSFVMSGAIGNFVDRLRWSYVVDFLDFHWQEKFKWPTFNVADVAISVGVGFLLLDMILTSRSEKSKTNTSLS